TCGEEHARTWLLRLLHAVLGPIVALHAVLDDLRLHADAVRCPPAPASRQRWLHGGWQRLELLEARERHRRDGSRRRGGRRRRLGRRRWRRSWTGDDGLVRWRRGHGGI